MRQESDKDDGIFIKPGSFKRKSRFINTQRVGGVGGGEAIFYYKLDRKSLVSKGFIVWLALVSVNSMPSIILDALATGNSKPSKWLHLDQAVSKSQRMIYLTFDRTRSQPNDDNLLLIASGMFFIMHGGWLDLLWT